MGTSVHLAIDLGAESGRGVIGVVDVGRGGGLHAEELHRFTYTPRVVDGWLRWDLASLLEGVRACVAAAKAWCDRQGHVLQSIGADSWGVDYGLLDSQGALLGEPRCYREPANVAAVDRVRSIMLDGLYARTGLSMSSVNTLVQLRAVLDRRPDALAGARSLLLMPDLVHRELCGVSANERTNASTTQMLNPITADWCDDVIGTCVGPDVRRLLAKPLDPGTILGEVKPSLGVAGVRVVLPGTHDTASAVAAVPASGEPGSWAFLSSGTWSIVGVELTKPVLTKQAEAAGLNNELGVDGTVRLLKNIVGLWLIQELRRDLASRGYAGDYAALADEARAVAPCRTLVYAGWGPLTLAGGMVGKLQEFAKASGQPIPQSPGELARCCFDSLALSYREALGLLEKVTGRRPEWLAIVGGGSKNALLNSLTASACGVPLTLGPVEASAVGNLMTQAAGLGVLPGSAAGRASLPAIRAAIAASEDWRTITPAEASGSLGIDQGLWTQAAATYAGLASVCPLVENVR